MADMCPNFALNYDGPGLVGVVDPDLRETLAPATGWRGIKGSTWIWGRQPAVTYTAYMPPNTPVPDLHAKGTGFFASRSNHPGGVNVLYVGGNVHFVADSIAINVWRASSTRAGGEIVSKGE
jgi:prepilin-type processing-associated H-X9-DG protein